MARGEDIGNPRPMIILEPISFFKVIDRQADGTAGGKELAVSGINVARKTALDDVAWFQLRHSHGGGRAHFEIKPRAGHRRESGR